MIIFVAGLIRQLKWVAFCLFALLLTAGGTFLYIHYRVRQFRQADVQENKDPAPAPAIFPKTSVPAANSLQANVREILRKSCLRCHNDKKNDKKKNPVGNILDHVMLTTRRAKNDPATGVPTKGKMYVTPNRPEESAIWLRIANKTDPMPPGEELSPDEKEKVKNWIAKGALRFD